MQSTQTPSSVPRVICPNETVGADIHAQLSQAKCVGAVPACPPERPRSGVSIPKIHTLCAGMNDGCAPAGGHGRAHRHRPYPSPSYLSTHPHTNKITIYAQSTQTTSTVPRAICPNEMCRGEHPRVILSSKIRRGGACVPARTSAQRRFHAKITYHVWGLNDGCAPVGRHGRAHRHSPYQPPPNHAVCHYLITLYIR